jgi:hypothetical protein
MRWCGKEWVLLASSAHVEPLYARHRGVYRILRRQAHCSRKVMLARRSSDTYPNDWIVVLRLACQLLYKKRLESSRSIRKSTDLFFRRRAKKYYVEFRRSTPAARVAGRPVTLVVRVVSFPTERHSKPYASSLSGFAKAPVGIARWNQRHVQ